VDFQPEIAKLCRDAQPELAITERATFGLAVSELMRVAKHAIIPVKDVVLVWETPGDARHVFAVERADPIVPLIVYIFSILCGNTYIYLTGLFTFSTNSEN
jgi:hypothetical protein